MEPEQVQHPAGRLGPGPSCMNTGMQAIDGLGKEICGCVGEGTAEGLCYS